MTQPLRLIFIPHPLRRPYTPLHGRNTEIGESEGGVGGAGEGDAARGGVHGRDRARDRRARPDAAPVGRAR